MALIENKVSSAIEVQDVWTNKMIKYPTSSALTNVGKSIGSSNYNFEEEQLLGGDRIITRQYDNNYYRETIEFRTESINNQYYFIEYYEYDTRPDKTLDASVSGETLTFDLHKIGNEAEKSGCSQKYELYQKDKNENPSLISTREVNRYNENGRVKIVETITNAQ